jgi:hypothetical protein
MAAFDAAEGWPEELSRGAIDALRTALANAVRAVPLRSLTESDVPLRDALDALCREAREKGVVPDALLASLKALWAATVADQPIIGRRRDEALKELVSRCVRAYYDRT